MYNKKDYGIGKEDILSKIEAIGNLLEEIFSRKAVYTALLKIVLGLETDSKTKPEVKGAISFLRLKGFLRNDIAGQECSSFCKLFFDKVKKIGSEWTSTYLKADYVEEEIYDALLTFEKTSDDLEKITPMFDELDKSKGTTEADEKIFVATREDYIYIRIGYTILIELFRYVTNNLRFRILLAIFALQKNGNGPSRFEISAFLEKRYNIQVSQSNFSNTVNFLSNISLWEENDKKKKIDQLIKWLVRPFTTKRGEEPTISMNLGLINIGLLPGYSRRHMYTLTNVGHILINSFFELSNFLRDTEKTNILETLYQGRETQRIKEQITLGKEDFEKLLENIVRNIDEGNIFELANIVDNTIKKMNSTQVVELLIKLSKHYSSNLNK